MGEAGADIVGRGAQPDRQHAARVVVPSRHVQQVRQPQQRWVIGIQCHQAVGSLRAPGHGRRSACAWSAKAPGRRWHRRRRRTSASRSCQAEPGGHVVRILRHGFALAGDRIVATAQSLQHHRQVVRGPALGREAVRGFEHAQGCRGITALQVQQAEAVQCLDRIGRRAGRGRRSRRCRGRGRDGRRALVPRVASHDRPQRAMVPLTPGLEHFCPDRNRSDPVIARRLRRSNPLPDKRSSARQAGILRRKRLAMTGLAGPFHSPWKLLWQPRMSPMAGAHPGSDQPEEYRECPIDGDDRRVISPADDVADAFPARCVRLVDLDLRRPFQAAFGADIDTQKWRFHQMVGDWQYCHRRMFVEPIGLHDQGRPGFAVIARRATTTTSPRVMRDRFPGRGFPGCVLDACSHLFRSHGSGGTVSGIARRTPGLACPVPKFGSVAIRPPAALSGGVPPVRSGTRP